ncbi:peptide hydrolase [Bacillus thuringiensis serovar seoulensis]|nr:peptide hydrolase [Bacillus thuringiensis serovar seoulensis]
MKKYRQITFTGLALLITGCSMFYTTPTSSVKAESIQNVNGYLI